MTSAAQVLRSANAALASKWDGRGSDVRVLAPIGGFSKARDAEVVAVSPGEQEWRAFFDARLSHNTLAEIQRRVMDTTWLLLVQRNARVAFPTCGIDDDGAFYFGWNPRERSLDISIDRSGGRTWFFVDHVTGFRASSDDWSGDEFVTFADCFPRP